MSHALILLFALGLDAAFGEPDALWKRLPHPAVLMGRAVGWTDRMMNHGAGRVITGGLAIGALALLAWGLGAGLATLGWPVELLAAAILLAQRSLVDHVRAVAEALPRSLEEGRRAVAMIVGRDTAHMEAPGVARAVIESAAENFSDGVVAPAFWFLVAGLPGMMLYKMVNTADSMIGYRTPKHEAFGKAAARLDDLLNWIPARLSALLLRFTRHAPGGWRIVTRDAKLHRSPNAGWPEAAMAVGLGVALSGPRSYHGEIRDEPFVNPEGHRDIGAAEIHAAVTSLWRAWGGLAAALALLALV
ncbi:MAG: adenosylcobinamide-phosphate synthase [Rhodobacterales bacterium]|nr:MAG: adenosylcobinamide-phosphate synthase [Rhodobacterales bacterium]